MTSFYIAVMEIFVTCFIHRLSPPLDVGKEFFCCFSLSFKIPGVTLFFLDYT